MKHLCVPRQLKFKKPKHLSEMSEEIKIKEFKDFKNKQKNEKRKQKRLENKLSNKNNLLKKK
jgi:hypothetical protein